MQKFSYVYLLRSKRNPERHYTGLTDNLEARLAKHNSGQVKYTVKLSPWEIEVVIGFTSRERAVEFERYLKGHSGRAFAAKHF